MLKKLFVQNYAIIDELEIQFSEKLNIITGETGAGKSILMGALSLILGDRADTSVLLNRDKKSVVEGFFDIEGNETVLQFLRDNELDITENDLLIRREIAASGKSRAFINDTPANLDQLKQLSAYLVDLHRQFDMRELGDTDFQRAVLDALAGHKELLTEYRQVYKDLQQARSHCESLKAKKAGFNREYEFNRFLFDELEEAAFRENELEDAESELSLLNNAEGIKSSLEKLVFLLQDSEEPMVQQLKAMLQQLQPYSSHHPALAGLMERIQSVQIELQDIADELSIVDGQIQYDAQRVQALEDRLSLGYKLLKKHGVKETADLISIKNDLDTKLQSILNIDEALESAEKKQQLLQQRAEKLALQLNEGRKKCLQPLEKSVNSLLAQVGMPNARFRTSLEDTPTLQINGKDTVEFLFDANKSNRFEPVRKVASGGELSRLMLCIKSLVAESLDLPTLIFDEIDTGISGEAARQVGIILKELAARRQVICITHQPQIAGRADAHFFVYKESRGESVKTNIRQLAMEERIHAIARMLGGEKPSTAAMENAKEMLMN
ncbi:MAG TPA: DNA repair protein RecN [Chitinophagaceae bacterium]|nr:DNA repair protein RecN [Chitinophagaceae bacterium]